MSRRHHRAHIDNTWPGFVDALSTLLLVIIFLLVVFSLTQFILSQTVSKKDEALELLRLELAELQTILSLEQADNKRRKEEISNLSASLTNANAEVTRLTDALAQATTEKSALDLQILTLTEQNKTITDDFEAVSTRLKSVTHALSKESISLAQVKEDLVDRNQKIKDLHVLIRRLEQSNAEQQEKDRTQQAKIVVLSKDLEKQTQLNEDSQLQIELLNRQLLALRTQFASLQKALDAAQAENESQKVQISALGQKLNIALANKVQELQRYRSEFFGRLREALGDRPDIRVVGDRFVFQSEVLFTSGSAILGPDGQEQLETLARTLKEISSRIPKELPWILRVDGHTDNIPINNETFRNNWELSSGRAVSVVRYLIDQGIEPDRLAATGFGEFHPIDPGTDEIALRRNRRIELKLTER